MPYGNAARTSMDIYIPAADKRDKEESAAAATSSTQAASTSARQSSHAQAAHSSAALAFFCHVGVWATDA